MSSRPSQDPAWFQILNSNLQRHVWFCSHIRMNSACRAFIYSGSDTSTDRNLQACTHPSTESSALCLSFSLAASLPCLLQTEQPSEVLGGGWGWGAGARTGRFHFQSAAFPVPLKPHLLGPGKGEPQLLCPAPPSYPHQGDIKKC